MKRWGLLLSATLVAAALPIVTASADEKKENHEKSEKKVTLDSIPAAARDGLRREAAGAPIMDVEEETKNGTTLYEGHVKKGNDVIGITVDASGKLVSKHSEKTEHEKKK